MIAVQSPVPGRTLAVSDVPDPVFSTGLVGPGIAIRPLAEEHTALAPVEGRLVKLLPHAFVVVGQSGCAVLVHLGIDTVRLDGAGFGLIAREGDEVAAGQRIVSWDPGFVARRDCSPICSVVVLDCDVSAVHDQAVDVDVAAGDVLFRLEM